MDFWKRFSKRTVSLLRFLLWGFGLVWLFFAGANVYRTPKFPFNRGWWGFTFPLGAYATSTTMLGSELPSAFFGLLGTIPSVAVTVLWIVVIFGTLQQGWTGEMLFAPHLKDLEQKGIGREAKDVWIYFFPFHCLNRRLPRFQTNANPRPGTFQAPMANSFTFTPSTFSAASAKAQ